MPPYRVIDGEEYWAIEKIVGYTKDPNGNPYLGRVEVKWWYYQKPIWHRLDQFLAPGNDGVDAVVDYLQEAFGDQKKLYKEMENGNWIYFISDANTVENDPLVKLVDDVLDSEENAGAAANGPAADPMPALENDQNQADGANAAGLAEIPEQNDGANHGVQNEGDAEETVEYWTHITDHKLSDINGSDLFYVHWLDQEVGPTWEPFSHLNLEGDKRSRKLVQKFIKVHFAAGKCSSLKLDDLAT